MTIVLPATHEPAVAIAMARCLQARVYDAEHRVTDRHPKACGWCDAPASAIAKVVDAFNAWAEFDDRRRTAGRHAVRTFAELTREEQERQIAAAQELGNDLWGVTKPPTELPGERLAAAAATPTPPIDVQSPETEEVPAWLR